MKLFRFVHWSRIFKQLNVIIDKILLNMLGWNLTKVADTIELLRIFIFLMTSTHCLACVWMYLGLEDPDDSWFGDEFSRDTKYDLYVTSFYWILETLTTVGYGDYSGSSNKELLFTMGLQFIGLSFFSFLMASINQMLQKGSRIDDIIDEKIDGLELWMSKIEGANKEHVLPNHMYMEVKKYVHDAYVNDFNQLIEDFNFY